MKRQKKILIIAPSWVGDLVIAQTLFKLLKKDDPTCTIDVLANKNLHSLLARMPEVDHALTLPFAHGELALLERFALAKKLRKNFYTHAYVLPNSFKSALIPFWAQIPVRIGWRGEFRYVLLNNIKILPQQKLQLMVERYAALSLNPDETLPEILPLPKLCTTSENLNTTLKTLQIEHPQKPILAMCPGAEYGPSKRWPAKYFAEVALAKKNDGFEIWIFGGAKDQAIAQEIQKYCGNICCDFTGKTDLSEAIDLLSLATIILTNDTGLMHIAAALDRPLVAIYGSSSPKFTPPLTKKVKIVSLNLPCSPCFQRECKLKHTACLYNLKSDLILENILAITKQ